MARQPQSGDAFTRRLQSHQQPTTPQLESTRPSERDYRTLADREGARHQDGGMNFLNGDSRKYATVLQGEPSQHLQAGGRSEGDWKEVLCRRRRTTLAWVLVREGDITPIPDATKPPVRLVSRSSLQRIFAKTAKHFRTSKKIWMLGRSGPPFAGETSRSMIHRKLQPTDQVFDSPNPFLLVHVLRRSSLAKMPSAFPQAVGYTTTDLYGASKRSLAPSGTFLSFAPIDSR